MGLRSGAPPWTPHQRASSPFELPGNAVELALDDGADRVRGGLRHLAAEPLAGIDEGDVAAVVGAEAQEAAARGGLEERAPAGGDALGERLVAEARREGLPEGGAGHRRVAEDLADPVLEREHLVPRDLEVAEPQRPQPVDPRAQRGDQLRQLVRRDEVERPPHRPGLDQRAVAPQGVPDVLAPHALDAGVDRELRGADDLRLHGDVVADDAEHRRAPRSPLEVLPLEPQRGELGPGGLDHAPERTGRAGRVVSGK